MMVTKKYSKFLLAIFMLAISRVLFAHGADVNADMEAQNMAYSAAYYGNTHDLDLLEKGAFKNPSYTTGLAMYMNLKMPNMASKGALLALPPNVVLDEKMVGFGDSTLFNMYKSFIDGMYSKSPAQHAAWAASLKKYLRLLRWAASKNDPAAMDMLAVEYSGEVDRFAVTLAGLSSYERRVFTSVPNSFNLRNASDRRFLSVSANLCSLSFGLEKRSMRMKWPDAYVNSTLYLAGRRPQHSGNIIMLSHYLAYVGCSSRKLHGYTSRSLIMEAAHMGSVEAVSTLLFSAKLKGNVPLEDKWISELKRLAVSGNQKAKHQYDEGMKQYGWPPLL